MGAQPHDAVICNTGGNAQKENQSPVFKIDLFSHDDSIPSTGFFCYCIAMKTVVIIDDHEIIRAGLDARLKGHWSIAGEAASLEEAKALFAGLPEAPDLVLLDIELGNEWGLDILKERSFFGSLYGRIPPVLVYSVYDDYAHVNAALRSGANGYICKSQGASDLLDAMESVASGKTFFTSAMLRRLADVTDIMLVLTKREREIFSMVQRGFDNRAIAAALKVSLRTIENSLSILYDKTGVKNRRELERL